MPNDFALEFAPFWAGDREPIEPADYLDPGTGMQLRENTAFSVASTQNYALNDSVGTNAIGFGARTLLFVTGAEHREKKRKAYAGFMDTLKIAQELYKLAETLAAERGCPEFDMEGYLIQLRKSWMDDAAKIFPGQANDTLLKPMLGELQEHLEGKAIDPRRIDEDIEASIDAFLRDTVAVMAPIAFRRSLSGSVPAMADVARKLAAARGADGCDLVGYLEKLRARWLEHRKEIIGDKLDTARANALLKAIARTVSDRIVTAEGLSDEVETAIDAFFRAEERALQIASLRADPKGLKVEVAGSFLLDFPTNENALSYIPKAGFWITPSYQAPGWGSVEILGVLRYLWYDTGFFQAYGGTEGAFSSNLDYGLRLVFKREKFSLEGEAVGRTSSITISSETDEATGITTTQSKTESDFQYVLNLNYQLKDNIVLSYNFGKQLEVQLGAPGDVVSTFTLNLGFGGPVMDGAGRITK